jgi:hypothetical protein
MAINFTDIVSACIRTSTNLSKYEFDKSSYGKCQSRLLTSYLLVFISKLFAQCLLHYDGYWREGNLRRDKEFPNILFIRAREVGIVMSLLDRVWLLNEFEMRKLYKDQDSLPHFLSFHYSNHSRKLFSSIILPSLTHSYHRFWKPSKKCQTKPLTLRRTPEPLRPKRARKRKTLY